MFLLLLITLAANAQINVLQTNMVEQDPNEKFINGISMRDDIGGVDTEIIYGTDCSIVYCHWYSSEVKLKPNQFVDGKGVFEKKYYQFPEAIVLTNYNPFPVNVSYEYELSTGEIRSGKIVVPPARENNYPQRIISIRKQFDGGYEVNKLITIATKLSN